MRANGIARQVEVIAAAQEQPERPIALASIARRHRKAPLQQFNRGMQLVLRHAFQTLRLHRVEANIQPGNHASITLARRAGFHREGYSPRYLKIGGRWRDHERWALLAEDWKAILDFADQQLRGKPVERKFDQIPPEEELH